jgi:hypothetical protein
VPENRCCQRPTDLSPPEKILYLLTTSFLERKSIRIYGKKERSRQLSKTVIKNDAIILSNLARKVLELSPTNYLKNVGLAASNSKTSEIRKTSSYPAFTHPTE